MEDNNLYIASISTTPSTPTTTATPPQSYGGGGGGGGGGFFYSAPTSPTHHSSLSSSSPSPLEGAGGSFEFEFTLKHGAIGPEAESRSMISADELFLNGQIRPMKLLSHLQCPQDLAPLIDVLQNEIEIEDDDDDDIRLGRGRDLRSRDRSKSLRRRTRSMSPLRTNTAFQWLEDFKDSTIESTEINEIKAKIKAEDDRSRPEDDDTGAPSSGGTSRSSSGGRNSKRWVFLKELLYRSKSEGRNSTNSNRNYKLWSTLSFSPSSSSSSSGSSGSKDKKSSDCSSKMADGNGRSKKAVNGLGMNRKRRVGRSAHEVHYTAKRAQAEEMRKKTYLPYRQGLLGCLGFSSKSYGAMNAFLNSVTSST